jgi:hypothetical protein
MSLLNQLLASQTVLKSRTLEARAKRTRKTVKPLKKTDGDAVRQAQSRESHGRPSRQNQESQTKARRGKKSEQGERVGVTIRIKNRKTG